MRQTGTISAVAAMLLTLVGVAWGQSAPTTQPAAEKEGQPLVVTVKEVTGSAQRLVPGEQDRWVALKVGEQLDELTIIRTGFSSRVVLAFADNSQVVVDRATKMGIGEFRKQGQVTKTALGLKYGAMRATVEKARGPNDFTVSSAVATLAVTGSGALFALTGDFGFGLQSSSGSWDVRMGDLSRRVRGTEGTNNNLSQWVDILKQRTTPTMGDVNGGLTPKELRALTMYGGSGLHRFWQQNLTPLPLLTPTLTTPTGTSGGTRLERVNVRTPGLEIGIGI